MWGGDYNNKVGRWGSRFDVTVILSMVRLELGCRGYERAGGLAS